ncbi:MFS transporter [Shewanella avicenniae]|uniref:MFS transporter n=1 Tax=Shewanella avicenniae TaxID=2814294 RepID=A0ABX7QPR2_9GAMM|nr:MFS transporter [Shewanella avicenniae]QSX32865.1 MFS transporter [Shewanella avicenniae]
MQPETSTLSPKLILLMAIATGVAVANNYYVQPLLDTIAQALNVSHSMAGSIVTAAQLSYGLGLFFLVPLADLVERRYMIVLLMLLATVGLFVNALAPTVGWLIVGTAVTGACSVVAQVLVPLAATLSAPEQRGKAVGTVMGGLLLGILLARVVAGTISSLLSWQAVYWVAAVAILICTLALWRSLPKYQPQVSLTYQQLLSSVISLFKTEPVLAQRSFLGALSFAMFTLFWTPLAFLLANPPYEYSDAVIGLFGIAGVAGVAAAKWAGKLADIGKGSIGSWVGWIAGLISWGLLLLADHSLLSLIIGIVLLDLAVQMAHVSNQNVVYALQPEARNRLNAGYMTSYFAGGALGSYISVILYQWQGWLAVCSGGIVLSLVGISFLGMTQRN